MIAFQVKPRMRASSEILFIKSLAEAPGESLIIYICLLSPIMVCRYSVRPPGVIAVPNRCLSFPDCFATGYFQTVP